MVRPRGVMEAAAIRGQGAWRTGEVGQEGRGLSIPKPPMLDADIRGASVSRDGECRCGAGCELD
jgi:hypothetical protein